MMDISLVPVGQVAAAIPAVLPFLSESAQWTRGRATEDDILNFILSGKMHLWVVHEDRTAMGHIITEVKQYPQCKMLTIQYCAMVPGTMEAVEDKMQELAEGAAKGAGCAGIEFVGRPGWRQTAQKYGYEVQSVMYQKFFEVKS
jgi:hypothetical protein